MHYIDPFNFLIVQVLKGVPEKPEVALVRLREIKYKIERKNNSQDRRGNKLAVKDIVRILEGPCRVRVLMHFLPFIFNIIFLVKKLVKV